MPLPFRFHWLEHFNSINFKEACAKRNNPEVLVNTGNPHHTHYFENLNNTKKNTSKSNLSMYYHFKKITWNDQDISQELSTVEYPEKILL